MPSASVRVCSKNCWEAVGFLLERSRFGGNDGDNCHYSMSGVVFGFVEFYDILSSPSFLVLCCFILHIFVDCGMSLEWF